MHAQDLRAIPPLSARVIDTTGTLGAEQTQALEAKLAAFEKAKGSQIVVLLVPSTLPEDITDYAQRVGDAWKIGRKDIGDGLLLVVAKDDRKVRIATSKALEGAVPDLAAKQIIANVITPRFKQGDFAGGLNAAADQLMARISGENLAVPDSGGADSYRIDSLNLEHLGIFLFLLVPVGMRILAGLLGRKLASVITGAGASYLAWLLTGSILIAGIAGVISLIAALFVGLMQVGGGRSSSGWPGYSGGGSSSGGGWGGASSGGGFSSGGGGDFGGGGASGDW